MPAETPFNSEMLPPALREVADVIGLEPTLRLFERYAGWRVYVPAAASADCELANVIGLDAAQRLVAYAPMQYLWVPAWTEAVRARRAAEIHARRAAGERPEDLARAYGITVRHVYKILACKPLVSEDN